MAEKPVKVEYMGRVVDAVEVGVDESIERWSEIKLEDGTILKVKATVVSAARIPGQFDIEGNPAYVTKMSPTMVIAETPAKFRKK